MPRWLPPLAIAVVGLLAYSNSFQVPFVYDDLRNVAANPHLEWSEWSADAVWGAMTRSPLPRPVAYLSFGLNRTLGGTEPAGYHAINLAIHVGCAWWVYALALLLLRREGRLSPRAVHLAALLAGLVFVSHPLQTQAVVYVVQRMTSLAAFFTLLAFWLYLKGRAADAGWRGALFAGAGLSWLLALGTKEIAVTLPLAVLLYECIFERPSLAARVRPLVAVAVGGGAVGLGLAFAALGSDPLAALADEYARQGFTPSERLLTEARVVFLYLGLVLWPLPGRLNLVHDVPLSRSLFDPATTALSVLGIVVAVAAVWILARRQPLVAFGIGWLLLHLVLESSLLPLALIYEHRMYLPLAGIAWLAGRALLGLGPRPATLLGAVLVALLALGTWQRNRAWADEWTLWSDVLAKNPSSYQAHNNLGTLRAEQGRLDDAIRHHREALRLQPDSAEALINLGADLRRVGRYEEAVGFYEEALRVAPEHPDAHNNLGVALSRMGEHDRAIEHYREALRISPGVAHVHNNLGAALLRRGDPAAALEHFDEAITLDPAYPEPRHNRRVALERLGAAAPR